MRRPYSAHTPVIKVCGITRLQDIENLAGTYVNAIGINFVPGSPRCVEYELAQQLVTAARRIDLSIFAIVRDARRQELIDLIEHVDFDVLQLHGSEVPESVDDLVGPSSATAERSLLNIVKALSWSGRDSEKQMASVWQHAARLAGTNGQSSHTDFNLVAMLVDAYAPDVGGGTGRVARWDLLQPRPELLAGQPLILAGGLKPENVAQGILQTACDGVDTASGVEMEPGVKCPQKCREFAANAHKAFASLRISPATDH